MPNYKEVAVEGTQHQRARLIQISNELNATPFIVFCEEVVTTLGGKVFHEDVGQLKHDFDPAASFDLVNPVTGELLGAQMTHQAFYVALYSLYYQLAAIRDTPIEVVPVEPVVP